MLISQPHSVSKFDTPTAWRSFFSSSSKQLNRTAHESVKTRTKAAHWGYGAVRYVVDGVFFERRNSVECFRQIENCGHFFRLSINISMKWESSISGIKKYRCTIAIVRVSFVSTVIERRKYKCSVNNEFPLDSPPIYSWNKTKIFGIGVCDGRILSIASNLSLKMNCNNPPLLINEPLVDANWIGISLSLSLWWNGIQLSKAPSGCEEHLGWYEACRRDHTQCSGSHLDRMQLERRLSVLIEQINAFL